MGRGWLASSLATFGFVLLVLAPNALATPRASVTEFPLPHADSRPYSIVAGPDGNLWFTESTHDAIGKITPDGTVTDYPLHAHDEQSGPYGIALGADGALWFTERFADKIGRLDPTTGNIQEFYVLSSQSQPWGITAMPDGTLWFTEENINNVGVILPNGTVFEYPVDGQLPTWITTGPDGNVWFTDELSNDIVRLDPNSPGNQTHFAVPTPGGLPWDIKPGPDGNLWFTELAGDQRHIGKITMAGDITEYPVPDNSGVAGIATSPAGGSADSGTAVGFSDLSKK